MSEQTKPFISAHDRRQNATPAGDVPRKRGREDTEAVELDKRPLSIRPDAANPFSKTRTFIPVALVSRSQISFSCLETDQGGSSIFSADIRLLESNKDYGDDLKVLVVHEEAEQRHYVIDRIQPWKYALCRLASWFRMDDLVLTQQAPNNESDRKRRRVVREIPECSAPWWTAASVSVELPVDSNLSDKFVDDAPSEVPMLQFERSADANDSGSKLEAARDQNPLEELTKQYLDALYLSRTSLAYFIKGPMARARAAFSGSAESSGSVAELTSFLRAAILSSDVMDKKYREHMAGLIKDLIPDVTAEVKLKPSKKRKWKAKRDKSGFFTDERDHAGKWWKTIEEQMSPAQDLEAEINKHSSRLRNREMFLQVMLILEILALESMPSPEKLPAETAELSTKESQEPSETKRKKRKETDISATLESLLDRLCIWSSLAATTPSKPDAPGAEKKSNPSDDMRGFCTEIIIPFYMSRIPQQASTVSKRLGGPRGPTVLARKSSDGPNKPGDPASRKIPEKKPRKPLARVSTDTLNQVGKSVPSLQRSATDLNILIKREGSEAPIPLAEVPLARSRKHAAGPVSTKRASLLHEVSFSKREVDLSAMSQASEAKVRKKAEVEQKLRDAISTLKKPNRAMATEDIAKSTDESFAKAIAKSRPSLGQRKSSEMTNPIVITATPRHAKSFSSRRQRMQVEERSFDQCEPTPAVPSSSARPKAASFQTFGSTPAVPQTGHRSRNATDIADTPSRGFAKYMPTGLSRQPGTLLESPTAMRSVPVAQTPIRCSKMPMLLATPATKFAAPDPRSDAAIGESARRSSTSAVNAKVLQRRSPDHAVRERSSTMIYDALGWDDSYEDLL